MELRQHCCVRHFRCPHCDGATVWNTAAALHKHNQIDHFLCRACTSVQYYATRDDLQAHCRASYTTYPRCPNLFVFRYQEALREHCLRELFTCPCCNAVSWFKDEEALKTHIRLEHFSCCFCNYQDVFASREGLLAHRRTAHGFFDCHYCNPHQPRIIWPASYREHMEQCHYPNPCNNEFHQNAFYVISYCGLCRMTFKPQNCRFHLMVFHYCQDCVRYESTFEMCKAEHLSECTQFARGGPQWWLQWQKEYDEAYSMRAAGPFQPENVHKKWQEQEQRNQKDEPNESAWKSFRRQHEDFSTQANEQRAPPPNQEPQETAPLDIYAILKISPESSPDDIKRAVGVRRIETHPDKRRRQESSREEEPIDKEAKLVGWAADMMLEPEKKHMHDEQMRA